MTLSDYIFKVIKQFGVDHTFGIPGDYALPLYASQTKTKIQGVICTHEPNAVFAADAYSRQRGLGVVLTTYGAGALNMINPVAMAFAEQSPLVIISGAPDQESVLKKKSIHHLVRHYETQMRIYEEICIECLAIQNIETAAEQIYSLFHKAVVEQRPVYLEIPKNLMNVVIPETIPFEQKGKSTILSDLDCLNELAQEILTLVQSKKAPVIIAGIGVRRYQVAEELKKWSENCSIPVVTSVMGKACFPQDHPNFRGMFMGELGDKEAYQLVSSSDCVIQIGVIPSDVNTGFWTVKIENERSIDIGSNQTRVSHHHFEGVYLPDLLGKLAEERLCCQRHLNSEKQEEESDLLPGSSDFLRPDEITHALNALDLNHYHVLSDIGDAWFIGLELRANSFMAPGYYASMGFAVPGALGASLAHPSKRSLVLVGDGAFQMTGNEIATLQRMNIPATVLVINNQSYKMLESFDEAGCSYDLYNWDYVGFAKALGCYGSQVRNFKEFESELHLAEKRDGVSLIELVVNKDLHPIIVANIKKLLVNRLSHGN